MPMFMLIICSVASARSLDCTFVRFPGRIILPKLEAITYRHTFIYYVVGCGDNASQ